MTSLTNVEYLEGAPGGPIRRGGGLDNLCPQVSFHAIEAILARPAYAGIVFHHVMRFHLEFQRSGCYERALRESMTDVGRALVITSVVLVADFLLMPALVLTFEPFGPGVTTPGETPPPRSAPPGPG